MLDLILKKIHKTPAKWKYNLHHLQGHTWNTRHSFGHLVTLKTKIYWKECTDERKKNFLHCAIYRTRNDQRHVPSPQAKKNCEGGSAKPLKKSIKSFLKEILSKIA